jgi:hypothetical protein
MYESHYGLIRCLPAQVQIASFQSGVLEYFHPRTLNLDGKMNIEAAKAIRAGQLDQYVRRARPEYIVDWYDMVIQRLPASTLSDYAEVVGSDVGMRHTVLWRRVDLAEPISRC